MIMKIWNIIGVIALLSVASACEQVDPMADEQYQKDVYIVGAYNRVATFELPYGEAQEAFVSVAISGSLGPDRDVQVTLVQNDEVIDWYNGKYMLDAPVKYGKVRETLFSVPSWATTIRPGEVYARLPFSVTSTGLHCDSLYAIGFAIESLSDYQKSKEDTALILTLKLTNAYSGAYQMEATKQALTLDADGVTWVGMGMAVPVSTQRTLTAVSADTVRFFHEKTKETLAEYSNSWDPGADYFAAIANSCITFGRIGESNRFTVSAYGSFAIIDGTATFSETEGFTFSYDYTESSNRYRMKGTFVK